MNNPLLQEWDTPFGAPPFDKIRADHFAEATEEAVRITREDIHLISSNKESPTFSNTVEAIEKSGELLGRISSILFNLNMAETNKDLQKVAQKVSSVLTSFSNDITLDERLFKRIGSVYKTRNTSGLNTEQKELLEKKFRYFILGGAGLNKKDKIRFREISQELTSLSLIFDENILEETNSFELHLTDKADLAGLPDSLIEHAATEASDRNKKGWIFTLHFPSYIPFMQHSHKRDLREQMYRAYSFRCSRENRCDNSDNVFKIINLRLELARLLGFINYAEMILEDRMAENPSIVMNFLEEIFTASTKAAHRDHNNLKVYALEHGHQGPLERWDWAFYSEKLKKDLYNIDDEILKPYFKLENVEKALLGLAESLFGLTFRKNKTIPIYHKQVKTYEVYDTDASFLALLYLDYYPRPGKSSGAWMTNYREQRTDNGIDIRPLISVVTNFTKPTKNEPSLLSFHELTTLLHEFGHALHGIVSRCNYESISGTNVARDFVELPSQFLENYAFEKEWLDTWAFHYRTGEKIPDHIIQNIKEASKYNEGYSCYRQLGFGFLDMAWHTLSSPLEKEINEFESEALSKTELLPKVNGAVMSNSFSHIFSGGYAAGYYGYKWAEVLDADTFSYFKEKGIFDRKTALSFRKNILERGASEKPLTLYIRFRGKEPTTEAFLKRSGLV